MVVQIRPQFIKINVKKQGFIYIYIGILLYFIQFAGFYQLDLMLL